MSRSGRCAAAAAAIGAAAWLGACGPDAARTATRPATPVVVERVRAAPFTPSLTAPGIVEAETRASLAFRVGGTLARFAAEEGERVEEGAPLAQLELDELERDVAAARAELARARARATEAELVFGREAQLFELATTSRKRLDGARLRRDGLRAELRAARLVLEAAEDRLAKGTLRAPFTGHLERRLVEPHEPAAAGDPVAVLAALDTVVVRSAVADSAVSRLEPGASARVRSAAWPGRVFSARVSRVDLAADEATRTFPFELRAPNPELALRPAMVVEVEVPIGDERPAASLPLAAVLRGAGGRPFCFVVEGSGGALRAARREVETGAVRGERVVIASGLAAGERAVVRGQHFLEAGDRVRIVEEEP